MIGGTVMFATGFKWGAFSIMVNERYSEHKLDERFFTNIGMISSGYI